MIVTVLAVYCVMGLGIVLVGPVGRAIGGEVIKMRGSPLANAVTGRQPISEGRLLAFRLIVSSGAALMWPVALVSVLREQAREAEQQKKWEQRVSAGLEFERMGGAGEISCNDCGFREEITSFMHGCSDDGERCCWDGRQCLSCGKFVTVHGEGEPARFSITGCSCGGQLSRDHVLFCPRCRSKSLRYRMQMIT